jgi:hypothetical protein
MIDISNIKIPYEKLLLRLGFSKSKTKTDDKTQDLIKENLNLAQRLIAFKAVVSFEKITINQKEILFESGYKIESSDISKLLRNCFMIYGAAITIGSALEKRRNEAMEKKEVFTALILDAAGSVAAEECISSVYEQIKNDEKEKNNELTRRFSCGYGDWDLKYQKSFLNWLGAEKIRINVNSGYLMNPEKSVSAIMGVKKITGNKNE